MQPLRNGGKGRANLGELSQWRDELDRLVAGFIRGSAIATPSAKACRYCDYLQFAAQVQGSGDDGEDADETAND